MALATEGDLAGGGAPRKLGCHRDGSTGPTQGWPWMSPTTVMGSSSFSRLGSCSSTAAACLREDRRRVRPPGGPESAPPTRDDPALAQRVFRERRKPSKDASDQHLELPSPL